MRKVMVFGTFDGVHEGHRAFLREAKDQGDYLIAVVAPDRAVTHLKGHSPRLDENARLEHVRQHAEVDEVVLGDLEQGTWDILNIHKPQVIALGYDQKKLEDALEAHFSSALRRPELLIMSPYQPDRFHSRLLTPNS